MTNNLQEMTAEELVRGIVAWGSTMSIPDPVPNEIKAELLRRLALPESAESAEAFWPEWIPREGYVGIHETAVAFAEDYAAILRQQLQTAQQDLEIVRSQRGRAVDRAEKAELEAHGSYMRLGTLTEDYNNLMVKYQASLKSAGEGWIPIARRIVSAKNLYCDHNPGDPCDICALEAALPPAPAKPAEGPAVKEGK